MAAALQAYLRRCGVASSSLKRYASYSQPQLVANQWTLRRRAGSAGPAGLLLATERHVAAAPPPPSTRHMQPLRAAGALLLLISRCRLPPSRALRCRLAPLPEGYDWQQYAAWAPDFCPLADDACY